MLTVDFKNLKSSYSKPGYFKKGLEDRQVFIFLYLTSMDTEMCCPKGKCECQYFILLTLKKKNQGHRGPGFF